VIITQCEDPEHCLKERGIQLYSYHVAAVPQSLTGWEQTVG
jgi:hypothetical protein